MSFKVIYGRAGSGKTFFCLNEIKNELKKGTNEKLIFVVPEQFSFQAEKELVKNSLAGGVLKNEVLSFGRLSYRIFNEEGGITYPHIHPAGKSLIINYIIEKHEKDFKSFAKVYNKQGFVEMISTLITEFKRYKITPDNFDDVLLNLDDNKELQQKLSEINMIYKEFEEAIYKKYIDADDDLTMAAKKITDSTMFDDARIWIDGFSGYTEQEYGMILQLLKKAKNVTITFCMDKLCQEGEKIEDTDVFLTVKKSYQRIIRMVSENRIDLERIIHLDHIYKFDNNYELRHLEKNYIKYPYQKYNNELQDISVNMYTNMLDEVYDVARKVVRLCQNKGYRYKDIAIVSRDITRYQKILELVLKEYEVPYFVDKKIELNNNNLIRFIVAMLEVFTENWSYEAVFRMLKIGFLDIEKYKIDRLENYVLACGIKGKKWTNNEKWTTIPVFLQNEKERQKSIELLEELNDTRQRIVKPLLEFRNKNNEKKSAREFCKDLYDLLCGLDIPSKLDKIVYKFNSKGDLEKGSEYSQVWNVLMDFLDQIVEVSENEKMTIRKFLNIFKTGVKEYNLGITPMGQDQVFLGSVERSKSHNIKAMFLLGVNDGIFPSKGCNEGILSDNDRNILKANNIVIAKDTKAQAFDEQFLIYQTLTVPNEILHISYPMQDLSGKSLRPSIIISRIKRIFPKLQIQSNLLQNEGDLDNFVSKPQIFNELINQLKNKLYEKEYNNDWDTVYRWFSNNDEWKLKCDYIKKAFGYKNKEENISTRNIHALYGENMTASVSRLEKFTMCPFGYYVEYGLNAKERKIYKLEPPDIGTFLHKVIDEFSKDVSKIENGWRIFDIEWCEAKVSEIVDKMLDEMKGSVIVSSKRYMTLIKRLKNIVSRMVWIIAKQIRDSNFNPLGYEVGFGENDKYPPIEITLDTGEIIKLKGRIDRIDKYEDGNNVYIRIIDYKSGNKKFELQDVFYGLQIQLLTYLDAIWNISDNIKPAGVLYLRLDNPIIKKDGNISDEKLEEELLKKLKMNGILLKDKDVIINMDTTIMGKTSNYIPASINKNGEIGARTNGATSAQFNILRQYTKKLLTNLCKEIVSGKVEINPYKKKDKKACDNCNFLSICQFDKEQNNYRVFTDKNDIEVWKTMENEIENK